MALAGNLQQAGVDGRYAAEEADLVALDNLPEITDQRSVAITLRGSQQHFGAADKGGQAGDDHTVDVEQRQAAEGDITRLEASDQVHAVGHCHFITVAVRRQFRRASGAAGVEVAGNFVGRDHPAAFQVIVRAAGDQLIEIQYAGRQGAALGLETAALRFWQQVGHVNADNRLEVRQLIAQAFDLGPQVSAGEGGEGDQQLRV